MRALLRTGFTALILLGLASQALHAGRTGEEDGQGAAMVLAARLAALSIVAEPVPDSDMLMAHVPACPQPFLVAPLAIEGSGDDAARPFAVADLVVRYVYLGAVEARLSRLALTGRWARAALLHDIGLRAGVPSRFLAMVVLPRACVGTINVDWAALSPG